MKSEEEESTELRISFNPKPKPQTHYYHLSYHHLSTKKKSSSYPKLQVKIHETMPTQYDALAGKESDECEDIAVQNVRSYEDLSITRIDEETVLNAVYADEFSTKEGPWGSRILCVKVQPLDTEPSKIGSQLT